MHNPVNRAPYSYHGEYGAIFTIVNCMSLADVPPLLNLGGTLLLKLGGTHPGAAPAMQQPTPAEACDGRAVCPLLRVVVGVLVTIH